MDKSTSNLRNTKQNNNRVELTKDNKNDRLQFKPSVEITAEQFNIEEVSADKVYHSRENYQLVEELDGEAYIAFRKNITVKSKGSKD